MLFRSHLPQSHGGIHPEGHGGESGAVGQVPHRVRRRQYRGIRQPGLSPARRKLAEHGIGCTGKTARQLRREDYERFDLIIGMDAGNLRGIRRICGGDPADKVRLLLDYAGRPGQEVADPWYTGDFEAAWQDVLAGCRGLLDFLRNQEV